MTDQVPNGYQTTPDICFKFSPKRNEKGMSYQIMDLIQKWKCDANTTIAFTTEQVLFLVFVTWRQPKRLPCFAIYHCVPARAQASHNTHWGQPGSPNDNSPLFAAPLAQDLKHIFHDGSEKVPIRAEPFRQWDPPLAPLSSFSGLT